MIGGGRKIPDFWPVSRRVLETTEERTVLLLTWYRNQHATYRTT